MSEHLDWSCLSHAEQLLLTGLVRVLVRMDGTFSPEEMRAVQRVVEKVRARDFWARMVESQSELPTIDAVSREAMALVDPDKREFFFAILVHLARVDGVDVSEKQMLMWLARSWQVDPSVIP